MKNKPNDGRFTGSDLLEKVKSKNTWVENTDTEDDVLPKPASKTKSSHKRKTVVKVKVTQLLLE